MAELTIVAFLQCLWLLPQSVERYERQFATATPERRAETLRRLLFYRGLTGKRLTAAFGPLCDEIVWEESTPQIATTASGVFPPDPDHIRRVVEHFEPRVIVTFGLVASQGVGAAGCWPGVVLVQAPHPAARHSTVAVELKAAAVAVADWARRPLPSGVLAKAVPHA